MASNFIANGDDLKESKREMASNFIANGDDLKEEEHHHHYSHHQQGPSPRGARRTLSTNSSSSACGAVTAIPKCLCAPTTHAGSFKCRLHRANSHGHAPPSQTSIPPPRPPVNSSTTPRPWRRSNSNTTK
ncbi:uncharacterized protein LOC121990201 [Zingiber officinale]|uniref:uncharacterized protein LOC121990201 n=1 Tax=Zingiber officinale TaxID=94328 RepID=UPI001C4DCCAE|nr:uncharacterized protein LOC121990201 [Zingiber officinale]